MARVMIVDEHAIVSCGLKFLLKEIPGLAIVSETSRANTVLQDIERAKVDLVILELSLSGRDGLDLLHEIRRNRPQLPVLVYTTHSEEEYGVRALKAGATGFLSKSGRLDDLITAIKKVSSGKKYVSATLGATLACRLACPDSGPAHELLSDREYQVMRKIAAGGSLKGIAQDLCVSPKTVSTYRARLLDKMNMKSNADIVRYFVQPSFPVPVEKADLDQKAANTNKGSIHCTARSKFR